MWPMFQPGQRQVGEFQKNSEFEAKYFRGTKETLFLFYFLLQPEPKEGLVYRLFQPGQSQVSEFRKGTNLKQNTIQSHRGSPVLA